MLRTTRHQVPRVETSIPSLRTTRSNTTRVHVHDSQFPSDLPWATVIYYTKKKERLLDEFGNLIHNERTTKEPATWTTDAKMALAIQVVAREMSSISEDQLRSNVLQLETLLPDLKPGPTAKHVDVVRIAAHLRAAADNLLVLRDELPGFNVSNLAAAFPQLLLRDPDRLAAEVKEAKSLLSVCGPAALRQLLEEFPQLLLPGNIAALLDDVARLFDLVGQGEGGKELGRERAAGLLSRQPFLARSAASLLSQTRGERDAEYLADTTRAEV